MAQEVVIAGGSSACAVTPGDDRVLEVVPAQVRRIVQIAGEAVRGAARRGDLHRHLPWPIGEVLALDGAGGIVDMGASCECEDGDRERRGIPPGASLHGHLRTSRIELL